MPRLSALSEATHYDILYLAHLQKNVGDKEAQENFVLTLSLGRGGGGTQILILAKHDDLQCKF